MNESFNKKVNQIYVKYLVLVLFFALSDLFFLFSIWFFLFSVIDNILNFNVFFRYLNLIAFLIITGRRLLDYYIKIKGIDRKSILIQIENLFNFKDTVISGYELQDSKEFEDFYISQLLKQSFSNLQKVPFSSLIEMQKFKRSLISFFLCMLFLILYSSFLTYNYKISLNRFINPEFKIKYTHKIVKVDIMPKNKKLLEGCNIEIKVLTYGKVKDVFLVLKNDGNVIREKLNSTQVSNAFTNNVFIYEYYLKNVYDDFIYYGETVQTRDNIKIKTEKYRISVVKEPLIKDLKLVYIYPSYTGLKPKTQADNGNIEAVEKTLIKISGKGNNNLKSASLYYNKRKIKLAVSGDSFYGRLILYNSGRYHIKFRDENDNTNTKPVNYSVIVMQDNPPHVNIIKPGRDITLSDVSDLALEIYAQDDYSVFDLKLFYKIKKAFIDYDTEWKNIPFNIVPQQAVNHKYNWDLDGLSFIPGDIIEYYAQVWDGYKPPKGHVVQSKKYIVKFPTMDEMYKQLSREHDEQFITAEDILKSQKEIHQETEKLIQDLEGKKELSYIMKKEVQQLKENQKKISEAVRNLSERMKQSKATMKNKDLFSLEILKKMEAVHKLLKEIGDKHMLESIQKFNNALKDIKLSHVKKEILSQKITQEKILQRLKKTLNMLKNIKNKQKVESFKKITEDLIKKQSELLKNTHEKKSGEKDHSLNQLKEKQERLKQAFKELKKDMKNFEKEMEKENSLLKDKISDVNKKLSQQNPEKEYNQSISSLLKNELSESMKSQKKILSKLNSIKSDISGMQMQSQQMDISRLLNVFDETIFNMLKTSEKTEQYKSKIQLQIKILKNFYRLKMNDGLYKVQDNNEIAEDLIFLERSIRWNKKNLDEQTKESIVIPPDFFNKFEKLADAVCKARKDLAEKKVFNSSKMLLNALLYNNVILKDLLKLKQDFKDQMQMQASQGMGDGLNQIANSQEQLNELTERLKGQTGKDGMSPQMQEYFEELAFQQEMIKKNLENFLNNFKQAGKLLGDLNQAAKEMNEIKKDLKSKKINHNLIKKQKKVLKRLLDSEKSLFVEDKAKKRETETAKAYKSRPPEELKKEKVEYKNKIYYYQHINKYPMEYKKLIDDYFKILNSIEQ